METKKIKIKNLKPYGKNPKKHWVEGIMGSIRDFGYIEPIVVDENDTILAGHGRLKALKRLGRDDVEVIVRKGLSEKQKEKYVLLSNKLVEVGGWDNLLLKDFEEDLLKDVGFRDTELGKIFNNDVKEGEIPFSEYLEESHNYIVLYFDNEIDWLQAQNILGLKKVKVLPTRRDGKEGKKMRRIGMGRVVKGSDFINKIKKDEYIN